jgi:hypothetical protein
MKNVFCAASLLLETQTSTLQHFTILYFSIPFDHSTIPAFQRSINPAFLLAQTLAARVASGTSQTAVRPAARVP